MDGICQKFAGCWHVECFWTKDCFLKRNPQKRVEQPDPCNIEVYSDVSIDNRNGIGACAYLITKNGKEVFFEVVVLSDIWDTMVGEVYAAKMGLEKAIEIIDGKGSVKLFTDCQSLTQIEFKKPRTTRILLPLRTVFKKIRGLGMTTDAIWVKGHAEHEQNKKVDQAARKATRDHRKKNPQQLPGTPDK